ncbi:MAG: MBL fold metallo-hydrolase, partial [Gammaproteobacteria bacterium]|nr:MBL fold metallo-hydrolase [Gammaproteobacteria bacterium]
SFMGPKRYTRHVVDYKKLPPINYVIISHNHYDHLDSEATEVLHQQQVPPRYYVPLGLKDWLLETDGKVQASNIVEMDWGDSAQHQNIKINALPSQHWSARSLFDRFETLWASWRVELGDFSFWFAGDTGYNKQLFTELGKTLLPVDLSFIPIGAYSPRDFMKDYHLNPEEAVLVHQHIKTKQSIGMHWGTYPLTAEEPTEPPIRLKAAADNAGLQKGVFSVMKLGETREIFLKADEY